MMLGGALEEAHDAGENDVERPGVVPAEDAESVEQKKRGCR